MDFSPQESEQCIICLQYLSLKKSISPRRVATASKTSVESQASGVVECVGSGSSVFMSGFGPMGLIKLKFKANNREIIRDCTVQKGNDYQCN